MERAVVLIRLHYHIFALAIQQQVRMIIHADAAEERINGVQQMCQHRAGGRLPVRTGYAERFHLPRHESQYFRPFADVKVLLTEESIDDAVFGHRGRTYDERVRAIHIYLLAAERRQIVLIDDVYSFVLQFFGQR